MESLCEFVIENGNLYNDIKVVGEVESNYEFADINRCINIIVDRLRINKNDIKVIEDYSLPNQTEIIISFSYNGRLCEFYEIMGIHKDYLGVELMPVS